MLAKRVFFLISLCCVSTLFAAPLKPNPEIVQGVLPNGLRYLIQPNQQPANKLELRLVMEAGSNGETDQQLGYAHFVEHMAFQHTKHFQKETVGQFIESLGMRIGPDSNAYTSFNETVFMLPVPTKDDATLKKAVTLLSDWVGGIEFRPSDALKESRVITEEWRISEHQRKQMRPSETVLFAGSRYLDRSPIGEMKQIAKADIKQLADFYQREYRPERATIIAVGDVNPTKLVQMIQQAFPDPAPSTTMMHPQAAPLSLEKLPATVVMSHDSLQEPVLKWLIPATVLPVDSEEAVFDGLALQMAQSLFARRLEVQAEEASFPISKSGLMTDEMYDRRDASAFLIVPRNGKLIPAWTRFVQEVQRAKQLGFTASEYAETKANMLNGFRQMVTQAHANTSEEMAASLLHDVLQRNTPISPEDMLQLVEKWFATNQLSAVNQAFVRMVDTPKKMLVAMLPTTIPLASVTAGQFSNQNDALPPLSPWQEKSVGSLLDQTLIPGYIAETKLLATGEYQYRLSNGMMVYLKPTQNIPGKVVVSAFARGGSYPIPASRYLASTMVDNVLNQSGVGDYPPSMLDKMQAGKQLSTAFWVGATEQGISASASTEDLETLFAMMHLQLTKPRIDPLVLAETKQDFTQSWQQAQRQTMTFIQEDLARKIWQSDYRKRMATPSDIQQVSESDIRELAQQLFVDSGPWTMVLVGDISPAKLESLLPKWLASVPAKQMTTEKVSLMPQGSFTDIRSNTAERQQFDAANRSQTLLLIRQPAENTFKNRLIRQVLEDVIQQRLELLLRQQLGLVYGVEVDSEIRRAEGFRLDVAFSSQAENATVALEKSKQVLQTLATQGVTKEELAAAVMHAQRVWEDAEKDDHAIAGTLATSLRYEEPIMSIRDRITVLSQLPLAMVNAKATEWLRASGLSVAQVNPFKEPS